jgi:SNF2 family DNA or RNA helicase
MNLQTSLFEHQVPAVDKMLPTRVGALFMDMGTGKTRTAIELAYRRRARIDRVVWFCPVSLKETIRQEIVKHTDAGPADIYVFDDKTNQRNLPRAAFWVIIGLESISGSNRVTLAARDLITKQTMVIVDESSYIKGHRSRRTERITAMSEPARYRLLLTGTPLSQGVVDLYSQMRFLSPAILGYGSFYSFAANHLEYSEKYPGKIVQAHNTAHLAAKIRPYVYQVTKDECLTLPWKLYDARYYHLSDEQQEAYWQAKDEFLPLLEQTDTFLQPYVLFQLFTALQEIVSGFWNRQGVLLEYPHKRIETLLDVITNFPTDAKVIIWCKFQYSVRQIVQALAAQYGAGAIAQHHGGMTTRERSAALSQWRAAGRFLVATQATGGHGLTLTEAHHAIFYENGFKYAERIQAEDRIHRIGQEERCLYVDLVAVKSIDERIQQALGKKANVVESFRRQVQTVRTNKGDVKELVRDL